MFCCLLLDAVPPQGNVHRRYIAGLPVQQCNVSVRVHKRPFLQCSVVTARTGAVDCLTAVMVSVELYKHKQLNKTTWSIMSFRNW